jgi:hypothetical protein
MRLAGQTRLLAGFPELFAELFDHEVKLMNLSDLAL